MFPFLCIYIYNKLLGRKAPILSPTGCQFLNYNYSTAVRMNQVQRMSDFMSPHSRFNGVFYWCNILSCAHQLARDYLLEHLDWLCQQKHFKGGENISHRKIRLLVQVWWLSWKLKYSWLCPQVLHPRTQPTANGKYLGKKSFLFLICTM